MLDGNGNNTLICKPGIFLLSTGGGTENFIGNYSGAGNAVDGEYAPGAGVIAQLTQLQIIISWSDGGAASLDWEKFAGGAALTNGISIKTITNGYTHNVTVIQNIYRNGHLPNPVFYEDHHHQMTIISTIPLQCPVSLTGTNGDLMRVTLNDNFTALTTLRFNALGSYTLALL